MYYEWARIRSLRSTWWIAGGSVVATAVVAYGYSAVVSGMLSTGVQVDDREAVVLVVSRASTAMVAAGVLGVLAAGNDYRYGTMRATLLVTPRRVAALGARAIMVGAFGVVLAIAGLVAAWLSGTMALPGVLPAPSMTPAFFQLCGGQVLLVSGWAVLGVAVTVLARSQLLGLAAILIVPFMVEPLFHTVGAVAGLTWLEAVAGHLPFSAGEAMPDISRVDGAGSLLAPQATRAEPLPGGIVFLGTVGALWTAAVWRFRQQDG